MRWFCCLGVTGLVLALAGRALAGEAGPTFNGDVAPILFKNCSSCHRPGQIGPFSLLSYADARKRAGQIARVTEQGIMPPWKPVAGHGEFLDTRALTKEQIAIFQEWAKTGMPEGDRADLPSLPKFKEGWQLGTPDVVLKMPRAFEVPAEGNDVYLHLVFPLKLAKEKYLRGIEVLPSNPRVAHHAVGLLDAWGAARKLAKKSQEYNGAGYLGLGGPGFIPSGFTPGYIPGATPRFFPDDQAITLKPGEDFVLQMHYHPTGKTETDQTVVGLYFTDRKPKRNLGAVGLACEAIDIPAGAKTHTVADSFKLPVDYEIRSIWAHMHLIGKSVRVWAELPDGTSKELLTIANWDFNWQDTYLYAKPFVLSKGTVVKAEWVYDNTADNPRNPSNPPKRVTLGENSTDEMAGLIIGGLPVNPWDELGMWAAVIGHYFEVHAKAFKK